ncbi:MAG: hypothetical protein BGN88_09765 [Clostridiales bacterium 43-6]|nr:MAG: hypothetical protein BGN88_09765 [Clostridiales bacterium 43-6]
MSEFIKIASEFLTECRNSALDELELNKQYIKHKEKHKDLLYQLESELDSKQKKLLEEIIENMHVVFSRQINYCYLCGIRDISKINNLFDESHDNWNELVDEFVN